MSAGKAVVKYTSMNGSASEIEINFSPPKRIHHELVPDYIERVDDYVARIAHKRIPSYDTTSIEWSTDLGYRNF